MKKFILPILLFMMFIPYTVYGDELELKWEHNYGGSGYEWFTDLKNSYDKDGKPDGYIVTGYACSNDIPKLKVKDGKCTSALIKYDLNGNVVWEKGLSDDFDASDSYNVFYSYDDNEKINGYALVVGTGNGNNHQGTYVYVYDLSGNVVIKEKVSDEYYSDNSKLYLRYDNNKFDGYYLYDSSNKKIVKMDKKFIKIDEKDFYSSNHYSGLDYAFTVDGKHDGYHCVHYSSDERKTYFHKYSDDLELEWSKEVTYNSNSIATKDRNGNYDGYYVYSIYSEHQGRSNVFKQSKYSLDGTVLWTKDEIENAPIDNEEVILSYGKDGKPDGFIFTGSLKNSSADNDTRAAIAKVSLDGDILWTNDIDGNGYDGIYDRTGYGSNHVIMSKNQKGEYDGYYIGITESRSTNITGIEGDSDGNPIFLKLDLDGNILWMTGYGGFKDESQLDDPRHMSWYGWDVVDDLVLSYDLNGNVDGVVYLLPDTSTDWRNIYNAGYMDPVIVKFGYHNPKMDISVTLDDKEVITYEKEIESTYKVVVKNIGNTDSDDNIIKTVIPKEIEIIEDSISDDGTYDKDSRTITWKYSKLMMGDTKEFTFKVKTKDKLDKNLSFDSVLSSSITNNQKSNEVKIIINPDTGTGISIIIMVIVLFVSSIIYMLLKRKKNYFAK